MQLQRLCEAKTDEAVQEKLGRLPPKLEDLYLEVYERLIEDAEEADREVTIHAFSWLLCAKRRLNTGEFLAALSLTPRRLFVQLTKEHVLEMCSNMIVFDATLDTFRFAHLSVREFLEKRPEYTSEITNSIAAERCLLELLGTVGNNSATQHFLSELGLSPSISTHVGHLSPYSTIHWAAHCRFAGDRRTRGILNDLFLFFLSNTSDPTSTFALWTSQLQRELRDDTDTDIENGFRLHMISEDIKWLSPKDIFVACCFDFPEVIASQDLDNLLRVGFAGIRNHTALMVAVRSGSCKVIAALLANENMHVEDRVVEEAASNRESGGDVMRLLLDARDVKITEEVLKAAANNSGSGMNVTKLLLDRQDIKITDRVLKSAAHNSSYGKELIELYLDRRGEEVKITDKVLEAAVTNSGSGVGLMRLLLDRRGEEVKITDNVLRAAARNDASGVGLMRLLLDRRGEEVKITDNVLEAAVMNWGSGVDIVTLIFDRRGEEVKITDKLLEAAVKNLRCGKELIELFLDRRGDEVRITDEVVKTAASGRNEGVLRLLLDRRGDEVRITDEVVKAAAENHDNGAEIINLLLDRRGGEVRITDEVVKAAAGCHEDIMRLLLDRRGDEVRITEDILTAAATNGLESVLQLIDERIKIPFSLAKWFSTARFYNAAKDGDESTIRTLLAEGIDPDLKDRLNRSPFLLAAREGYLGLLEILLDTQAVDINSRSIYGYSAIWYAAFDGNDEIVRMLLKRNADPNLANLAVRTPLAMAEARGHRNIVEMLTAAGARR